MNSKKAITILVLVTMLMALMPVMQINAAIVLTRVEDKDGNVYGVDFFSVQKGKELYVVGEGVTAGATVNVYWDDAMKETFTAGSGKIASGTAKAAGTYKIKFSVPEATLGTHYIWVRDVSSNQVDSFAIEVVPKLSVSPGSGLKGDKATLTGYGYQYDADDKWMREITIEFMNDLADAPTTKPQTNSVGTFTYTFTVKPDIYGDYSIWAASQLVEVPVDPGDWVGDYTEFTVGAAVTLSISEGPVGSVLTITGRGFEPQDEVTVTIDTDPVKECYIVYGDTVRSGGRINTRIVIPSAPLDDGDPMEYQITVSDESGNDASAKFEVTDEAKITADPSYGMQGTQITVKGENFARISGTSVVVTLGGEGSKTFKTDSNGAFTGTFLIPAVGSGTQTLEAKTTDHDIEADSKVRLGIMLVMVTPESGPSGTKVTLTGVGWVDEGAGQDITVHIGDEEWFTGTSENDGTFSITKNIPTLDPGAYLIKVVEDDSEITFTVGFTVTEKTKLTLTPAMAPNEYLVTIEGWYFTQGPTDTALEFILYNATQEWVLNVYYPDPGDVVQLEADEDWDDGYFKGKFEVPDADLISLGSYTLNVTDMLGLHAQATFNVVDKTQSISPRKQVFAIGDTVSFTIELSFGEPDSYIKIYDPGNDLFWTTDKFEVSDWVTVGTVQRVPYYQQTAGENPMLLLSDAPLGVYTWKYFDSDGDLIDEGVFTVEVAPESVLAERIEDLNNDLLDLSDQVSGVSSELAGVKSDINSAKQSADAAKAAADQATAAVNSVATVADNAQKAANEARDAAQEAKQATQGLTTLVYGAIGAALVAALAAIVSLMQISQKIAG